MCMCVCMEGSVRGAAFQGLRIEKGEEGTRQAAMHPPLRGGQTESGRQARPSQARRVKQQTRLEGGGYTGGAQETQVSALLLICCLCPAW